MVLPKKTIRLLPLNMGVAKRIVVKLRVLNQAGISNLQRNMI